MKIPIPSDWNGQDWRCVEVQWPDSPVFIAILQGLLTEVTRGRFWDEKTGLVTYAQGIGFEIHVRNFPLLPCGANGTGTVPAPDRYPCGGGGIMELSEECEDMPAITWLTWNDAGELVMHFGPCCEVVVEGTPNPGSSLPPGGSTGDPPTEQPDWACRRAVYMATALITVANQVVDCADDLVPTPTCVSEYYKEYTFHFGYLMDAIVDVWEMDVANNWQEGDQLFYKQMLACRWAPLIPNSGETLSEAVWSSMLSIAETVADSDTGQMLRDTMLAIGRGDLSNAGLAGLLDDTVSCDCPAGSGSPDLGAVIWSGEVTVNREDGAYSLIRRFNGGLSAEHQFITATGSYKALDIDHKLDIESGTTLDDLLIAIVPILPTDELLHTTWLTSNCGVVDADSFHGQFASVDRIEQNINPLAGVMWYEEVWSSGKASLTWQTGESRSCPQNQTEAKTYRWYVHIARYNGVETGVIDIPDGI